MLLYLDLMLRNVILTNLNKEGTVSKSMHTRILNIRKYIPNIRTVAMLLWKIGYPEIYSYYVKAAFLFGHYIACTCNVMFNYKKKNAIINNDKLNCIYLLTYELVILVLLFNDDFLVTLQILNQLR